MARLSRRNRGLPQRKMRTKVRCTKVKQAEYSIENYKKAVEEVVLSDIMDRNFSDSLQTGIFVAEPADAQKGSVV